jgi:hypothetical protein
MKSNSSLKVRLYYPGVNIDTTVEVPFAEAGRLRRAIKDQKAGRIISKEREDWAYGAREEVLTDAKVIAGFKKRLNSEDDLGVGFWQID